MGCGASKAYNARGEVEQTWAMVWETVEVPRGKRNPAGDLVIQRSGWKTIRIFVSSTFKDFHQEREILIKQVFPDLRVWCEKRRLHLVECDLRWGVPKDTTSEFTLRTCLSEIDRCYADNVFPFFVNMTSERIGWIPDASEVPETIIEQYKWIHGLSVTEMEIMHAAYRNDNPNALFMIRRSSFLQSIPEQYRDQFLDQHPMAPLKLEILKKMIGERFPKQKVIPYTCEYAGFDETTNLVKLGGLTEFAKKVFEFFKDRIERQYPVPKQQLDTYQAAKEAQESFMKSKAEMVLGRDAVITEILNYVTGVGTDVPLMLVGGPGSGKSSIIAKVTDIIEAKAINKQIPGGGSRGWHVFYHFVGSAPGTTELEFLLKRLLKEVEVVNESTMPSDIDSTAQLTLSALSNPRTRPVVVIIDAVNQLDECTASTVMSWVPRKLAPQIRCIFSMIGDTPCQVTLKSREPAPMSLFVGPLDCASREAIVSGILGMYNKRLDEEQMQYLLSKTSSENPLWLSIACEELRIFGQFRQVTQKIKTLADGLLELEMQVLERFEQENGGQLLVAALCLLECSAKGLLETELLAVLGDEEDLMPNDATTDEKVDRKKEKRSLSLPAFKWAEVYRALRPFLRPFGDSGEGRLDFYHRSLSKAVRIKYFYERSRNDGVEADETKQAYFCWHKKLADFFENREEIERKTEEYPYHLVQIKDPDRLAKCLVDWRIFDRLYSEEYSSTLIRYWQSVTKMDSALTMQDAYQTAINNLKNTPEISREQLSERLTKVAQVLLQGGKFDVARTMLEQALEIEKNELGQRSDRMMALYWLQGCLEDEIMKLENYMYKSQLPQMKLIMDNFKRAIEICRGLEGKKNQYLLGRMLNRLAFYYGGWSMRGGTNEMSSEDAQTLGNEAADEAIGIFTALKDEAKVADAMTTKGVVIGRATPKQIKIYNEALEKMLAVGGELHIDLDRLYLNMAIYHEEVGSYYQAYDYFFKWMELCRELFGIGHPRTFRCIDTLNEPMYKRIATERGDKVPAKKTE